MLEAHPGRRHHVGVDVVEQLVDPEVVHGEVDLARELAPDQLRVLGQEEHPLSGGETDDLGRLHVFSMGVGRGVGAEHAAARIGPLS